MLLFLKLSPSSLNCLFIRSVCLIKGITSFLHFTFHSFITGLGVSVLGSSRTQRT